MSSTTSLPICSVSGRCEQQAVDFLISCRALSSTCATPTRGGRRGFGSRNFWNGGKPFRISRSTEFPTACPRAAEGLKRAQTVVLAEENELQQAKNNLLNVVVDTGRGIRATTEQRAIVEEALVGVEKFDAGTPLELDKLDGTWLLQYTTAPDVVQILQASETPFIQVGQIFQKFECSGYTDGGVVRNVIRWSIPGLLQEDDGATLVVTAKFFVVSSRNIALSFEEAQLVQVVISEGLQGLLAPAILPRTFLNLEVLQFFRSLDVRVPLAQPVNATDYSKRVPVGLLYYLSYLDQDMLVGRALGSGGVFIFSRTQRLHL